MKIIALEQVWSILPSIGLHLTRMVEIPNETEGYDW